MADKAHAQIPIRLYWLVRPRWWLPVYGVVWRVGRYWCCGVGAFRWMLWIGTKP